MADELAEINGIKPKVVLDDGEEREVGSLTSKSVYKAKRTFDHFYCSCPAWRNQPGVPVNARTCKHLKSLLGDEYEDARVLMKNPDGPPPKTAKGKAKAAPKAKAKAEPKEKPASTAKPVSKAKPASKAVKPELKAPRKPPAKRGRADPDDEEGEDGERDDGEEEASKPAKRARTEKKEVVDDEDALMAVDETEQEPKSKGKGKQPLPDGEDDSADEGASAHEEGERDGGDDELAIIDGHRPGVNLKDGEETQVGSKTSKAVYKVKRTWDHYYCSCPAWRNQSGVPVNARTCKHLKSLLGDAYEEARLNLKNPDGPPPKGAAAAKGKTGKPESKVKAKPESKTKPASKSTAAKPESKAKATNKRKKPSSDDEDEDGEEEEQKKPMKRARGAKTEAVDEEEGGEGMDVDEEGDENGDEGAENEEEEGEDGEEDELAIINGIRPKVVFEDGEEREVGSLTSNAKYKCKRTFDHFYCTCPAWRNQGGVPVNARTCKHLKSLLGEAYENARVVMRNPDGPAPKAAPKAKSKKKAAAADDDGEEEEEEAAASGKDVPALLLANKWDIETGPDPSGWWMSEKLDGVRTYYDGERMVSRLSNLFTPPKWFLEVLPKDITLDGELFGGRGKFQSTVSVVKTMNSPHWKGIMFQIFDIPSLDSPFEERIEYLQKTFGPGGTHASEHIVVVEHEQVRDKEHVLEKLKEIEGLGGEGLMLRRPGSMYEGHRSASLLKIKTFYDAEAVVTGYVAGKGKNAGITGALKCKMASGKTFSVGTRLSDKQRRSPPKIGAIIVYRFQELTQSGVPRFPSYIGEAIDKAEPKDAEVPEHRKPGMKPVEM